MAKLYWLLYLGLFLQLNSAVNAQQVAENTVPANALGVPEHTPHSPSITSFHHSRRFTVQTPGGSQDKFKSQPGLISAYSYMLDGNDSRRRVGISRSKDSGQTWEVIRGHTADANFPVLPFPLWGGAGNFQMKHMEDPQVIANERKIVLVARAFSDVSTDIKGDYGTSYQRLDGTIFRKSGIYIMLSSDSGQTWGYWDNNGSWTTNYWGVVAENDPASQPNSTLEWPRVAWRNEYINGDQVGYVVWGKKVWSYGTPGQGTANDDYYRVTTDSKIGIRAFASDGKLYPTGVGQSPYLSFPTTNCSSITTPVERPSIAIAPDNSFWLSFNTLNYSATQNIIDGKEKPWMKVWLGKGFFNSSTKVFSLPDCVSEVNPSVSKHAFGYYDPTRGYTYAGLGKAQTDWNIDLAQGPSIQVAQMSPQSCSQEYHVGMLYTYSNTNEKGNSDNFVYRNHFSFNSAKIREGTTPQQAEDTWITEDNLVQEDLTWLSTADGPDIGVNPLNIILFSTLKYTTLRDPLINGHQYATPDDYTSSAPAALDEAFNIPSQFVIGYFGCTLSPVTPVDNLRLGEVNAAMGFSPDNTTFKSTKYVSGVSYNQGLIYAPRSQPGIVDLIGDPEGQFWGSKMDVTGDLSTNHMQTSVLLKERGPKAHIIWKEMLRPDIQPYSGWRLRSNRADVIIARAHIRGYPSNDPLAFPKANSSTNGYFRTNMDPTGLYPWGDYVYFNYDDVLRPTLIQAKNSITTPAVVFDQFVRPISSTFIASGLYYGTYKTSTTTSAGQELGNLGYSNQRKAVMTGAIGHLVYENANRVYYSIHGERTFPANQLSADQWSPPAPLESVSGSTIYQLRPSIAVYQQATAGNAEPNGKSAIAITWVELTRGAIFQEGLPSPSLVKVKMRTREFDACKGDWFDWSPVYTVHSHQFIAGQAQSMGKLPGFSSLDDDMTTPVIAPVLAPYDYTRKGRSTLIGWTVTWTGPQYLVEGGMPAMSPNINEPENCLRHTGLYSRTRLRRSNATLNHKDSANASWGVYENASTAWQPDITALANGLYLPGPCDPDQPLGFPTVVSSENRSHHQNADPTQRAVTQEIAFSHGDSYYNSQYVAGAGIKTFGVEYAYRKALSVDLSGNYVLQSNPPAPGVITRKILNKTNLKPFVISNMFCPPNTSCVEFAYDRNPNIMVNSSGQRFVAWERTFSAAMLIGFPPPPQQHFASIRIAHTPMSIDSDWVSHGARLSVKNRYTVPAADRSWDWLLNPSLSGFPRTWRANDDVNAPLDMDPGAIELFYWQKSKYILGAPNSRLPINALIPRDFHEPRKDKGKGAWLPDNLVDPLAIGTNPQLTFGTYNGGPSYRSNNTYNGIGLGSINYAGQLANVLGQPVRLVPTLTRGAYKPLGTFDTLLGVELYRHECRVKDSSMIDFVWGRVYVGDVDNNLPECQVRLDLGQDSINFTNADQIRDSLFRTAWFELSPSAELRYWRGMMIPASDCATLDAFDDPTFRMQYTVVLEHLNGQRDTIEQIAYSPFNSETFAPGIIRIPNFLPLTDTVRLRVFGSHTGLVDEDSLMEFDAEVFEGEYPSYLDTTLFNPNQQMMQMMSDDVLEASGPYPNPSSKQVDNNTIMVNAEDAEEITIGIYDTQGIQVEETIVEASKKSWQKIKIKKPKKTGTYFVRIQAGNKQVVLQQVVTH